MAYRRELIELAVQLRKVDASALDGVAELVAALLATLVIRILSMESRVRWEPLDTS